MAGPAHDEVRERFTSLSIGADSCLSKEARQKEGQMKDGNSGEMEGEMGKVTLLWRFYGSMTSKVTVVTI